MWSLGNPIACEPTYICRPLVSPPLLTLLVVSGDFPITPTAYGAQKSRPQTPVSQKILRLLNTSRVFKSLKDSFHPCVPYRGKERLWSIFTRITSFYCAGSKVDHEGINLVCTRTPPGIVIELKTMQNTRGQCCIIREVGVPPPYIGNLQPFAPLRVHQRRQHWPESGGHITLQTDRKAFRLLLTTCVDYQQLACRHGHVLPNKRDKMPSWIRQQYGHFTKKPIFSNYQLHLEKVRGLIGERACRISAMDMQDY
jgi:hypothetical protein